MRGGHREGAGRPFGLNNKYIRWPIRWTRGEAARIELAADMAGKKPTAFIRDATMDAIQQKFWEVTP